jgi:cytochrome c oxidase subunit 3
VLWPDFLVSTSSYGRSWFDPPRDDERAVPGEFLVWGMRLFLVSLAVLFAASLVAHFATKRDVHTALRPTAAILLATGVLIISSATIHLAVAAARRGDRPSCRKALLVTLILGTSFLLLQAANWSDLLSRGVTAQDSLNALSFYCLTLLHALHVIGGVAGLAWVTYRSMRGAYTPANYLGVRACALYWHFLDVVWLVLFTALFIVR